jgi:hypothetical protein
MKKLASEKVILSSPLSFTGSCARLWRITNVSANPWVRALILIPLTLLLILLAWSFVLTWYSVFGILVIPWRLFRRSQRKGKQQRLQHREMLAAIDKQHS